MIAKETFLKNISIRGYFHIAYHAEFHDICK
jgi:hypothetical protein